MNYIENFYHLPPSWKKSLRYLQPSFGGLFGEVCYYRSYSRQIKDDDRVLGQEGWADTVCRVVEGVMSIRYDWYMKNRIKWDSAKWHLFARKMALSMFHMRWLPSGRGLWAMGTDLVAERGAMPLYNCAFTELRDAGDYYWLMDCLMNGVGVGFKPIRTGWKLEGIYTEQYYTIEDTRESWAESVRRLIEGQQRGIQWKFDYSLIRPYGAPIKTFGGTASGPEPLMKCHRLITDLCDKYRDGELDEIQIKTDIANIIGVCVVSGNVRRGAEIGLGEADDPIFHRLKDYTTFPYRAEWGWMSNNTVLLTKNEHFELLGEIALKNIRGHDVGYLNMMNVPFGRIGKDDAIPDKATGLNPCGEIPLEHREVCNLAETLPTRCLDVEDWLQACTFATFYCSTVALLPTHDSSTNEVVLRNRRIGVSLVDFTGWKEQLGTAGVIAALRKGYKTIKGFNKTLADEAGVRPSLRLTTVKPGGTVPKMAGRTSGASYPTFEYILRRINVGVDTPIDKVLFKSNVPREDSVYTPNTRVYSFPIVGGPRPATKVSLWEQAANIVLLQREWSDNAVSNTLYFKPQWSMIKGTPVWNPDHEENCICDVLEFIAPYTKSVSLLPHSPEGAFEQMPEEGITKERFDELSAAIGTIDWSSFENSDGEDEKYCSGPTCEIKR